MIDIIKKIIIVLIVLILGYFAYTLFLGTGEAVSVDSGEASTTVGADILVLVDKLEATNIDPTVFSSSLFSNLKDFSVTVLPEAVGKSNPFTSTGVDGPFVEVPVVTKVVVPPAAKTSKSSSL